MRKFLLFTSLFLGIVFTSHAQEKENSQTTDVTKLTFFSPGASYEKSIGKSSTLMGGAFLYTSIDYSFSSTFGSHLDVSFDPAVTLQYRYYYNYNKRQAKGKRTDMNSLNYISPIFESIYTKARVSTDHYPESKARPINHLGVVWGLQRNYEKRFSLDLNLGLGYLFTTTTLIGSADEPIKKNVSQFTTLGNLNLGFWLNKRK